MCCHNLLFRTYVFTSELLEAFPHLIMIKVLKVITMVLLIMIKVIPLQLP